MKKLILTGITFAIFGLLVGPLATSMNLNGPQNVCSTTSPTQTNNEEYTLLIITPKVFVDELCPLVCHKNAMGVSTRLVTLDDVFDQMYWHGRDCAEKVKYFIKTAMEEWGTRYVLLVGGRYGQFFPAWYFPVRYVEMGDDWESEFLSDLYFADIYDANGSFSSWDSDNDGRYGEWYSGETAQDTGIDFIPDVAVGRLPCRSEKEAAVMVDHIITYETSTYEKPWFSQMLVIAGDTYPESQNPNWTGYEGEYYGDCAIENMSQFTPTKLYTSDGTFSNKKDVIREFRNGWGFTYFVGHGSPKQWGNNLPNGTDFIQGPNTNDMWRFRNKDELPVCIVSGCHNSQFDVSLIRLFNASTRWKQEYVPECWSERIIHQQQGGAIASIGCTALGYTKEDKTTFQGGINELETAFFHAYGQHNVTVLGDVWAAAITWYAQTYPVDWNTSAWSDSWIDQKVLQSWALLGDPSLQIGGYPS
jgi:hypothetical protein